jgi:hypothetical protein
MYDAGKRLCRVQGDRGVLGVVVPGAREQRGGGWLSIFRLSVVPTEKFGRQSWRGASVFQFRRADESTV